MLSGCHGLKNEKSNPQFFTSSDLIGAIFGIMQRYSYHTDRNGFGSNMRGANSLKCDLLSYFFGFVQPHESHITTP